MAHHFFFHVSLQPTNLEKNLKHCLNWQIRRITFFYLRKLVILIHVWYSYRLAVPLLSPSVCYTMMKQICQAVVLSSYKKSEWLDWRKWLNRNWKVAVHWKVDVHAQQWSYYQGFSRGQGPVEFGEKAFGSSKLGKFDAVKKNWTTIWNGLKSL